MAQTIGSSFGGRSLKRLLILWRLAVGLTLLGLALQIVVSALVMHAIEGNEAPKALRFSTGSALANGRAAEHYFQESDFARSQLHARNALADVPLYPRALRLFGFALERQGSPRAAEAMRLAASLGWRDIPTQLWLAEHAAARKEWQSVALRGDAIARQGFEAEAFPLLQSLLPDPIGRRSLLARLHLSPKWRRTFILSLANVSPDRLPFTDALIFELTQTRMIHINEVWAYIEVLVRTGRLERARRLWMLSDAYNPARAGTYLYDASFSSRDVSRATSRFEWRLFKRTHSMSVIGNAPVPHSAPALWIRTSGTAHDKLASQLLVLPQGRFEFSIRATTVTNRSRYPLRWRIVCHDSRDILADLPALPGLYSWRRLTVQFAVPPHCDAQEVQLLSEPGSTRSEIDVWFDDAQVMRHVP